MVSKYHPLYLTECLRLTTNNMRLIYEKSKSKNRDNSRNNVGR